MDRRIFDLVSYPFVASAVPGRPGEIADIPTANREAYTNLVGGVRQRFHQLAPDDFLIRVFDQVIKAVQSAKVSDLPPLSKAAVDEYRARHSSLLANDLAARSTNVLLAEVAGILAELSNIPLRNGLDNSKYADIINTEIASYVGWKAVSEAEAGISGSITASFEKFEKDRLNWIADAQKLISTMQERVIDLQAQDNDFKQAIDHRKAEWIENIKAVKSETDALGKETTNLTKIVETQARKVELSVENFEAFRVAILEEARGTETRKLWKERAEESWRAFIASAVILIVFLLLLPAAAFRELDWVLATLKHIGDAATVGIPADAQTTQMTVATISRLVVITFPLVLYLWVIRLVVRFNTRSLVLFDDARQRQTMMDTFFMLIEQKAASPEERGLILNALFRPSPGHGGDNVEPPNFTELIGKAGS